MSSSEAVIAALDNHLADSVAGEDIVLRRMVGQGNSATPIDVTVRAAVRNWRLKEELLVADFRQAVLLVIISPTQIATAQWPGGSAPGQTVDPSHPRRGDKLVIKGRLYNVEACEVIGNPAVRFEMQALG